MLFCLSFSYLHWIKGYHCVFHSSDKSFKVSALQTTKLQRVQHLASQTKVPSVAENALKPSGANGRFFGGSEGKWSVSQGQRSLCLYMVTLKVSDQQSQRNDHESLLQQRKRVDNIIYFTTNAVFHCKMNYKFKQLKAFFISQI